MFLYFTHKLQKSIFLLKYKQNNKNKTLLKKKVFMHKNIPSMTLEEINSSVLLKICSNSNLLATI